MIFKINSTADDRTQRAYEEAMASLNDFWGIDWTSMTPNIYVVESRKDMDLLKGKTTEPWMVAFAKGNQPGDRKVYILDYDKFTTESSWQITEEAYKALLKHELSHLFHGIVSGGATGPMWLSEGMSIFLSGQLKVGPWKRPEKFTGFIESDFQQKMAAYSEGGFVVELLINEFGKDKMIQFIKSLAGLSKENYAEKFQEIFSIPLTYEAINNLYTKKALN